MIRRRFAGRYRSPLSPRIGPILDPFGVGDLNASQCEDEPERGLDSFSSCEKLWGLAEGIATWSMIEIGFLPSTSTISIRARRNHCDLQFHVRRQCVLRTHNRKGTARVFRLSDPGVRGASTFDSQMLDGTSQRRTSSSRAGAWYAGSPWEAWTHPEVRTVTSRALCRACTVAPRTRDGSRIGRARQSKDCLRVYYPNLSRPITFFAVYFSITTAPRTFSHDFHLMRHVRRNT